MYWGPYTAPHSPLILLALTPLSPAAPFFSDAASAATLAVSIANPRDGGTITGWKPRAATSSAKLIRFATGQRLQHRAGALAHDTATCGVYFFTNATLGYALLPTIVEEGEDDAVVEHVLATKSNIAAGDGNWITFPADHATSYYVVLTTAAFVGPAFVHGTPFKKATAAAACLQQWLGDATDDTEHVLARIPGALPFPFGLPIGRGPYDDTMSSLLIPLELQNNTADKWGELGTAFNADLHAAAIANATTLKKILPSIKKTEKWGTNISILPTMLTPSQEAIWRDDIQTLQTVLTTIDQEHHQKLLDDARAKVRDELARNQPPNNHPMMNRMVGSTTMEDDDATLGTGANLSVSTADAQKAIMALFLSTIVDVDGKEQLAGPIWTADADTIFNSAMSKTDRATWYHGLLKTKTTEYSESYDFNHRAINMPPLSKAHLAFWVNAAFATEAQDSIEEAKHANGITVFHLLPPSFIQSKEQKDIIATNARREREEMMGESGKNLTKLDTAVHTSTYLGWCSFLNTWCANLTCPFSVLALTGKRDLKPHNQPPPDVISRIREGACTITHFRVRNHFEKNRITNPHMPYSFAGSLDVMFCQQAEFATDPTNIRHVMQDNWHKIPVQRIKTINQIFLQGINRFTTAAMNGEQLLPGTLWLSSPAKQKKDDADKRARDAEMKAHAELYAKQNLRKMADNNNDRKPGGQPEKKQRVGNGTNDKTDNPDDYVGFIVYDLKGKMPMPNFPDPTNYYTCAGFIRQGAKCRMQGCPGKHEGPNKMPIDILRLWRAHVYATPHMSWNPVTVPSNLLHARLVNHGILPEPLPEESGAQS